MNERRRRFGIPRGDCVSLPLAGREPCGCGLSSPKAVEDSGEAEDAAEAGDGLFVVRSNSSPLIEPFPKPLNNVAASVASVRVAREGSVALG
jgi:hypothetical protein